MKKLITIFLLFTTTLIYPAQKEIFSDGEYLEYNVSFWGIDLGNIKIYTDSATVLNGIDVYKHHVTMKSNPSIPFVSLDATFNSWIDTSYDYSHEFIGTEKSDDMIEKGHIRFLYDINRMKIDITENGKKVDHLNYYTRKYWNDGTSLFYYARKHVDDRQRIVVPTIITKDTATTVFYFNGKRESVVVDAINYPVKCVYFNGQALWEGIYGMNGKFQGWFSDDEASIPILAKMNVYVGNVRIELVDWKRKNWQAPRY